MSDAVANRHSFPGGCHCGAVRFECDVTLPVTVYDCNCSMCRRSGYLHLILPRERFRLLRGSEALVEYTFNTGIARHLFCGTCGVKSFYVPRSNPDGYSVNLRCLDDVPEGEVTVAPFDGRDWEAAMSDHGTLGDGA